MAQGSLIQVRVDDDLKHKAEALFNELGLDTPSAIRLFLKQSIIHHSIPFPITAPDDFFNDYNMKTLKESISQLDQGKTVTKTMDELDAMVADE